MKRNHKAGGSRIMKVVLFTAMFVTAALAGPIPAFAYVGPGAGLSLIGAFWALILAIFTAVFFLVAWPVRRLLRQRRNMARRDTHNDDGSSAA
jgi:membrane protein implicated in regulation of membrane protease activity